MPSGNTFGFSTEPWLAVSLLLPAMVVALMQQTLP
jgi:hypothetical protein